MPLALGLGELESSSSVPDRAHDLVFVRLGRGLRHRRGEAEAGEKQAGGEHRRSLASIMRALRSQGRHAAEEGSIQRPLQDQRQAGPAGDEEVSRDPVEAKASLRSAPTMSKLRIEVSRTPVRRNTVSSRCPARDAGAPDVASAIDGCERSARARCLLAARLHHDTTEVQTVPQSPPIVERSIPIRRPQPRQLPVGTGSPTAIRFSPLLSRAKYRAGPSTGFDSEEDGRKARSGLTGWKAALGRCRPYLPLARLESTPQRRGRSSARRAQLPKLKVAAQTRSSLSIDWCQIGETNCPMESLRARHSENAKPRPELLPKGRSCRRQQKSIQAFGRQRTHWFPQWGR